MICILCGKEFQGKKEKPFCYDCYSSEDYKNNHDRYDICWKKYAVQQKGGKCKRCGYNKSLLALEFHHNNPKEKENTICNLSRNNKVTKEEIDKELKKM